MDSRNDFGLNEVKEKVKQKKNLQNTLKSYTFKYSKLVKRHILSSFTGLGGFRPPCNWPSAQQPNYQPSNHTPTQLPTIKQHNNTTTNHQTTQPPNYQPFNKTTTQLPFV